MRVQRHSTGSVRWDRRRGTWNYLWYEAGKRRSKLIGNKQQFPTKAATWKEVQRMALRECSNQAGETVETIVRHYEVERMPSRHSTARVYRSFLTNHIIPKWG